MSWVGRESQEGSGPAPDLVQGHLQESHPVPERVVQKLLELCQTGALTTSLGSHFQCPATLWVKRYLFLIPSLRVL